MTTNICLTKYQEGLNDSAIPIKTTFLSKQQFINTEKKYNILTAFGFVTYMYHHRWTAEHKQ